MQRCFSCNPTLLSRNATLLLRNSKAGMCVQQDTDSMRGRAYVRGWVTLGAAVRRWPLLLIPSESTSAGHSRRAQAARGVAHAAAVQEGRWWRGRPTSRPHRRRRRPPVHHIEIDGGLLCACGQVYKHVSAARERLIDDSMALALAVGKSYTSRRCRESTQALTGGSGRPGQPQNRRASTPRGARTPPHEARDALRQSS